MQREIQALFRAYLLERDREAELIQKLLAALAVGSDARRKMISEITAAVNAIRKDEAHRNEVAMPSDDDTANGNRVISGGHRMNS